MCVCARGTNYRVSDRARPSVPSSRSAEAHRPDERARRRRLLLLCSRIKGFLLAEPSRSRSAPLRRCRRPPRVGGTDDETRRALPSSSGGALLTLHPRLLSLPIVPCLRPAKFLFLFLRIFSHSRLFFFFFSLSSNTYSVSLVRVFPFSPLQSFCSLGACPSVEPARYMCRKGALRFTSGQRETRPPTLDAIFRARENYIARRTPPAPSPLASLNGISKNGMRCVCARACQV